MALYHSEVYMPTHLANPCHRGRLRYTKHALRAALDDRYGAIVLPTRFVPEAAVLIETETDNCDQVQKQVWRIQLDEKRDLILVIMPTGWVKTVWSNLRTDHHNTLNRQRYVSAPEPVEA